MHRRHFLQSSLLTAATLTTSQITSAQPEPASVLPAPILTLKDRRSEAVPITLIEREHRLDRARDLMQQNRMDALFLVGGTSLTYFTGLRWGNSERMTAFVQPAKGAAFLICPHFEEDRLRERLATVPGGQSVRIYTWHEDESPSALVGKGLSDLGLRTATLGIEERTPFTFANAIARANPHLTLIDATPITAGCRMLKSPAELALMRLACDITWHVYKAAFESGHPGLTTQQFTDLIDAGYHRSGFPGEASCQTGIYSALPHGSQTPQIIRENSIVLIDDGCLAEGYQSDLSRTFVYGKPTGKVQRVFDIVHQAQTAAYQAAKAGNECQAVDAAARNLITAAGFGPDYKTFLHRVGHGIGMDMHEWTYLVRGNNTKLQLNMTFSDEPGIYLHNEFGIRLEDDMVITETTGQLLSPQSHSLTNPFAV